MKRVVLILACIAGIGVCHAMEAVTADIASFPPSNANLASPATTAEQELQQAQAKWNEKLQSGHYIYTLEYTPKYNKPLRIRVKDEEVVQVMIVPDNSPLPARRSEQVLTVDDLFAAAKTGLASNDTLQVMYDQEYGYPVLITTGGSDGGKYKASGMRLLE